MSATERTFDGFSVSDWTEFIGAVLDKHPHVACEALTETEPHHILIQAFSRTHNVPSKEAFRHALARAFASTPTFKEYSERLFYLIQVVSYCTPPDAAPVIRQLLLDETLYSFEFAERNLQMMLVVSYADYGIDETLVDYVWRTAQGAADTRFLFIALRILSQWRDGELACVLIEQLLARDNDQRTWYQLIRELRGIGETNGYRRLFVWLSDRSPHLAVQFRDNFTRLLELMRDRLIPWRDFLIAARDPYKLLLASHIHAGWRRFSMNDIVAIAHLCRVVGRHHASRVLDRIWSRHAERYLEPNWLVSGTPAQLGPVLIVSSGKDRVFLNTTSEREEAEIICAATLQAPHGQLSEAPGVGDREIAGRYFSAPAI